MEAQQVQAAVKAFILKEFLPGEDPNDLTETTPLITTGIIDSIATLKLVTFLEKEFNVTVEPHEADADHLDTLGRIAALVVSKKK